MNPNGSMMDMCTNVSCFSELWYVHMYVGMYVLMYMLVYNSIHMYKCTYVCSLTPRSSVCNLKIHSKIAVFGCLVVRIFSGCLQFHVPLRTQQAVVASARYRKPTEKPITIQ